MKIALRQLKGVMFDTDKSYSQLDDLYHKVSKELYRWADDSVDNVIEVMCEELNCKAVRA